VLELVVSELSEISCRELADVADELALGVLTGRERALALAHLGRCGACREVIQQRLTVAGELPGLLPASDPLPGFADVVLARIGLTAPRPGSRRGRKSARARCLAAAGVLAVVCAGVLGRGLRFAVPQTGPLLVSAALIAPGHRTVGRAFAYRAGAGWDYISVDLGSGRQRVTCQVDGPGGQVTTVGTFWLADGRGSWGGPDQAGPGRPTAVRLVAAGGTVLASATFT
jgi:hypothetical protein